MMSIGSAADITSECLWLTSIVFLETTYAVIELSCVASAIRSMSDHPYSEVVSTHGDSAMLWRFIGIGSMGYWLIWFVVHGPKAAAQQKNQNREQYPLCHLHLEPKWPRDMNQ